MDKNPGSKTNSALLYEAPPSKIKEVDLSLSSEGARDDAEKTDVKEEQFQIRELKPMNIVCVKPSGLECRVFL